MMEEEDLAEKYRAEVSKSIAAESNKRLSEIVNPAEEELLLSQSLIKLANNETTTELAKALMVRLKEVRSALTGHGGNLIVDNLEVVENKGIQKLSLQLNLDGACIACGAAPGTLQAIHDDLMLDDEISSVNFSSNMLLSYDELTREFLQKHGNVTFI